MVRTVQFMERRQFRRHDASGTAVAVSADYAVRAAVSQLSLRDVSDGGLSAVCHAHMPVASPIRVLLPTTTAGLVGRLLPGRVVRCQPIDHGYRVAVAFDSPPTVAG